MAKKTAAKPNAAWPAHADFAIGEFAVSRKLTVGF